MYVVDVTRKCISQSDNRGMLWNSKILKDLRWYHILFSMLYKPVFAMNERRRDQGAKPQNGVEIDTAAFDDCRSLAHLLILSICLMALRLGYQRDSRVNTR